MSEEKKMGSILIVDDSETIRSRIHKVLQTQKELFYNCYEAKDGLDGFKVLTERKIDLILCDMVMPQMDGLKLLALVKNHPELKMIPFIMLTAEGEQNKKNMALERGASDYLTKPFDEVELLARARVHLELKLLQDQLKEANKRLTTLSITDALTEVYNRRHLMKVMVNEIHRAKRYGADLSFLLLDIDNFKHLNDTLGHQAGDQVLHDLCVRLRETVRVTDIVARYGGEEFAVLLPQVALSGAETAAEKVRKAIEGAPFEFGEARIPVTVSGGISCFVEGMTDTVDTVIMEADKALYQAKKQGRNRVVLSRDCSEALAAPQNESGI